MTPRELLFAHRYSEAAEAYRSHLSQHPADNYHDGLGNALLCLEEFSEASSEFRLSNEIEGQRLKGAAPWINHIGTAMWLSGERRNAMQEWHLAVEGILEGRILYGDLAGGAEQGLLLWYGAVTLGDSSERAYALEFLGRVLRRKVYRSTINWPRPIVQMLLGESSFEKVLEVAAGASNLETAMRLARTGLLKRRQLCQLLFYAGCQQRELGNEADCRNKMALCCELENPIIELEWYLAQAECHSGRPWRGVLPSSNILPQERPNKYEDRNPNYSPFE